VELVTQADPGLHNSALTASTARIIEGATWKKQRIVTLIPCGNSIPSKAVHAWMNLIFPPNQANFRWPTWMAMGLEVGDAYSQAIEQIVVHPEFNEWEYILTVETDNLPPPDGVLKLIRAMEAHPEFACIGGLYWTKGEEGVPQIWGDITDPVLNFRPQAPVPGQLVECCGTGMGFNLWRMSMFKDARLRRPWFKTLAGVEGTGTQDLYFWTDARQHGYRCAVDCSCLVGHLDPKTGIAW
jgi:hypothetical protein